MIPTQLASIFLRQPLRRMVFLVWVLGLLATPGALAQDAGVSGVPPGPANAGGLNGSVNDPSGIGNAAKTPAIKPPNISPVMPPSISTPPAPTRPYAARGASRGGRIPLSKLSPKAAQAVMKERERMLDKLHSICRGC